MLKNFSLRRGEKGALKVNCRYNSRILLYEEVSGFILIVLVKKLVGYTKKIFSFAN